VTDRPDRLKQGTKVLILETLTDPQLRDGDGPFIHANPGDTGTVVDYYGRDDWPTLRFTHGDRDTYLDASPSTFTVPS